MNNSDQIYAKVGELEKFADLERSEWGRTAKTLTDLWQQRTLLSDALIAALEQEISTWLDDVKTNAEIIEEMYQPHPRIVQSLEWKN